jgi:hypothetical protein
MNANELVDVFDTYAEPHDWGKQAVAMLRQQQVEIDTYKSQINSQIDTYKYKELTDKEILSLWDWNSGEILATDLLDFADAILRKARGDV